MEILDTDTVDTISSNGNTSNIRARYWQIVINNYNDEKLEKTKKFCEKNCTKFYINQEKGENNTPHLQIHMEFKNARYFNSLKKEFPDAHIEKVRNRDASAEYCQKEETAIAPNISGGTMIKKIKDPLENKTLHQWQKDIINLCKTEPDDRKVNWYYDEIGGKGKTSLAKHLWIKNPKNLIYLGGKANDIKHGVKSFTDNIDNDLKICIFDFTRSIENYISYEAIENVKNGFFFNGKYEACMVGFNSPHVIIFANFQPDITKLSLDRWNIVNINDVKPTNSVINTSMRNDNIDNLIDDLDLDEPV